MRVTGLANIKPAALPAAIATVTKVFDDACRFIEGNSQSLLSLGVSPTLAGLEADWQALLDCQKAYAAA